jgi:hypothetical protein
MPFIVHIEEKDHLYRRNLITLDSTLFKITTALKIGYGPKAAYQRTSIG